MFFKLGFNADFPPAPHPRCAPGLHLTCPPCRDLCWAWARPSPPNRTPAWFGCPGIASSVRGSSPALKHAHTSHYTVLSSKKPKAATKLPRKKALCRMRQVEPSICQIYTCKCTWRRTHFGSALSREQKFISK